MSNEKETRLPLLKKMLTLNNPNVFEWDGVTLPLQVTERKGAFAKDTSGWWAAADDWKDTFDTEEEMIEVVALASCPEIVSEIKAWCDFQKKHLSKGEKNFVWDEDTNEEKFRSQGASIVKQLKNELYAEEDEEDEEYTIVLNIRSFKTIKLMNEYTVKFPVWYGVGFHDCCGPMSPDELPISDELKARLSEWADVFLKYFHWDDGWMLDKAIADGNGNLVCNHKKIGLEIEEALIQDLSKDTSSYWNVYLDYWEN